MNYAYQQTTDEYLLSVLKKYQPDFSEDAPVFGAAGVIIPFLSNWAGDSWLDCTLSGSYAKGTAVSLSSDVDLFLSMDKGNRTLSSQYFDLSSYLKNSGFNVRNQNVSIGVNIDGYNIDIVPGWKHPGNTNDHSLFRRKVSRWTKTNVAKHIDVVCKSGRTNEIKLCKIWKSNFQLEFPSFYLELAVIDALYGSTREGLADNIIKILTFFRDDFASVVYRDPANQDNIVSNDLTAKEKQAVAKAAEISLRAKWTEVFR